MDFAFIPMRLLLWNGNGFLLCGLNLGGTNSARPNEHTTMTSINYTYRGFGWSGQNVYQSTKNHNNYIFFFKNKHTQIHKEHLKPVNRASRRPVQSSTPKCPVLSASVLALAKEGTQSPPSVTTPWATGIWHKRSFPCLI